MIQEIFAEIKRQGIPMAQLERQIGYCRGSFAGWAHGRSGMKLASFVDIAQHLGYEVILRPINTESPDK
jgi:lambda repressor-like predicted transcriptional regulator